MAVDKLRAFIGKSDSDSAEVGWQNRPHIQKPHAFSGTFLSSDVNFSKSVHNDFI